MTTDQAVREAAARSARRRRRLIGYGQWHPFTAAEPVRRHVRAIQSTGMSAAGIVHHTGVNCGTLNHLLYGTHSYPPSAKIRIENANALLAYWPKLDDYDDGAVIDGTGTRRRVQALAANGWPSSAIHRRVDHIAIKAVERLRTRERVTARTARAVRDLYIEVSGKPAEAFGVTSWVAQRSRSYALKSRWANPSAWDDDTIDDPNAIPDWTGYCGTDRGWWTHRQENIPVCPACDDAHTRWKHEHRHLARPEFMTALIAARANAAYRGEAIAHDGRELLAQGLSHDQAAERLGITRSYLRQELGRRPESTGEQVAA
ncbi:helix-turn-helix transcriptional regulator [Streptomyces sp. NBC_00101]|uniref:helix-turn-helix domain-containing protein n=1 Tax=Streptomyces sp. NBC_00101 TaxID=2975651 RepID=UPI0032508148